MKDSEAQSMNSANVMQSTCKHNISGPKVSINDKDERIQGLVSETAWHEWQKATGGKYLSSYIEGLARLLYRLPPKMRTYVLCLAKDTLDGELAGELVDTTLYILTQDFVARRERVHQEIQAQQEQQNHTAQTK